jgi:hypothetical protein
MRMLILAAVAALSFAVTAADAAPNCSKGKLCGDTCIPKEKTCRVTSPKVPNCKTGKLCGNACIPKDKVCRK